MSKTETGKDDEYLGNKVKQRLTELNIETPMVEENPLDSKAKITCIEKSVTDIMSTLGLDLQDDSLQDTPKRVAKMWVNELMWGLDYANFPKATVVENKMGYNEMLLERKVSVKSMCEHHWQPITGVAFVAYIPKKQVLGLSKFNRIVEFFSRRPQVQERLTVQIAETLKFLLDTEDIAVCIAAEHGCVRLRGVEDACSDTVSSSLSGAFLEPAVRAEFYSLINLQTR